MSPENTSKASPGRPGRAYCPKCGRGDVTTRWERGVEKYNSHTTTVGGSVNCFKGSNQPVVPPTVQQ